jgi:hypothetical protein
MTRLDSGEEVQAFRDVLGASGLHEALRYLNGRTPYRFTGVYRYDGDTLRNVALFDRWDPEARRGSDAPINETFCAIVRDEGAWLEVEDGPLDERFPWMQDNAVVCYSGALIRGHDGEPFGSLCHFDVNRVQQTSSDVALLQQAGRMIYDSVDLARY